MCDVIKLKDLMKEISLKIPGVTSVGVSGIDGNSFIDYPDSNESVRDVINAHFSLLLRKVKKSTSQYDEPLENNLLITDNAYLMSILLGDGSVWLGIRADRKQATLGNMRLIGRKYGEAIWNALPKP